MVYKDIKTGNYNILYDKEAPHGPSLCYKNNTYFFRNDINMASWNEFIDIIIAQFKDIKKLMSMILHALTAPKLIL